MFLGKVILIIVVFIFISWLVGGLMKDRKRR